MIHSNELNEVPKLIIYTYILSQSEWFPCVTLNNVTRNARFHSQPNVYIVKSDLLFHIFNIEINVYIFVFLGNYPILLLSEEICKKEAFSSKRSYLHWTTTALWRICPRSCSCSLLTILTNCQMEYFYAWPLFMNVFPSWSIWEELL